MRLRILTPAIAVAMFAGCSNMLDVKPNNTIPASTAITDGPSARGALEGAYKSLQSLSYYGEDFTIFGDLSSDNVDENGTFSDFADVDANQIRSDNPSVYGIYSTIYDGINRANELIAQVPHAAGMDETEQAQILGEAYLLRALHYHNLVKLFAGVPIVTAPSKSIDDAVSVTRASVEEVYQQIESDLSQAEQLITNDPTETTHASVGAVKALEARVFLYHGEYQKALDAAQAVEDMGYELAPNFPDLFTADGTSTPEDILRVVFTAVEYNDLGYYYLTSRCSLGGRAEVIPSDDLIAAYDESDARFLWTIGHECGSRIYGAKFPTAIGAEHPHVIRLGEVILIKAEALARQNQLAAAVDEVNRLRERAGIPAIAASGKTQQQVLDAVTNERRLELALEGDRWPDLVRLGIAAQVMDIDPNMTLYPIPQQERNAAPGLTQNPGY